MAGLRDELPEHLRCGWQKLREIRPHEEGFSPDCEWCMKPYDRQVIFVIERDDFDRRNYAHILKHDDFNHRIKVGSTCVNDAIAVCVDSGSHGDESNNKAENGLGNGTSDGNPPPDEKPLPVPELLFLAGASIVLIGNLGLFEDFYSRLIPNESPLPAESQVPSESPGNANNRYRNKISPEAEEKLRECLKENIKSLVGVPGLSDLVESLTNENESSITETQRQVRLLYNKIQQLRKTITDCDPSLIKELIEADKREEQENKQEQEQFRCQDSVIIIGGLVNIRLLPSSDSEVIAQALYGTCLQIDNQAFNYPSEEQRQAIDPCECWYPVILPNGMRGYVHHHYASRVPSSP